MWIAVVGMGYWGSKHVRVLSAMPQVSGVIGVDTRASRRDQMAAAYPGLVVTGDVQEALARADAMIIATSPSSHVTLALAAIRSGRHVLVEKPLATTASDARLLVDAAEAAGVTLMAGHTFEYNSAVIALTDLVASGELGEILYVDAVRVNLGLYQTDCNVIWDLAPHDVSIVNRILGSSPTHVSAWGNDHIRCGLVDNAYLQLEYGSVGTRATVHVSWLNPHKVRQITVVGSYKMAVFDDLADDERLRIYDKGVHPEMVTDPPQTPLSYRYGSVISPYIPFREPLAEEDAHFVECIQRGLRPRSDGRSGLEVVRVLEAADRALDGVRVDMHPLSLVNGGS